MSSRFTCRFCKEQFDVPKGLYKHLQIAHNTGASRDNRTCPICGVLCSKYEGYRDHLLYIHGQTSEGEKLSFKSLNEFLLWKAELELKHNCKYVLQTSPKVLPNKDRKYFYQCDRSSSKSKDKKNMSVVMKTCTSVISVLEGASALTIEYWDTHSGHSAVPSRHSLENELDAAISSVEMVNAIGDSDDSFDRSDDVLSGHSSPKFSNSEKQSFFSKTSSPSNVNSFNNQSSVKKTSAVQSSGKTDSSKKKSANTSILFSLASVACGKGITKKTKTNENKDVDSSKTTVPSEKANENSVNVSDVQKGDSVPNISVSEASGNKESSVKLSATTLSTSVKTLSTPATTLSMSVPTMTRTVSSGLQAIAPKITSVSNNAINSLITTNSAFQNQLVIVNPVGMDQNVKQNVFTTGQNILFSLGSLGQNIVPTNSAPVSINSVSVMGDKNTVPTANTKVTKADTSVKISTTPVPSVPPKISSTVSQNVSKSNTSAVPSTAASTVPITLSNAPVILSSLPVGSTFMSVNNSLIPIATPSGAFLPTSLPPNIVLTPVLPGTTLPNLDSSIKTTYSSTTAVSASPNIQAQLRFTTPSTVAITVSSIVKEPVFTSSAIKHMSNIVTSNTFPVSSASSIKTYSKNKNQSKVTPMSVSGQVSPFKNTNKFATSTPIKSNANLKENFNSANKAEVSSITYKALPAAIKSTISAAIPSVTVSSASVPKVNPSARKRMKSSVKSKSDSNSINNLAKVPVATSSLATKVVNSQLNLAPISSATITPQQTNVHKPGSFLFESSGDIYMLEPVENDDAGIIPSPPKRLCNTEICKIKIDRAAQTNETSDFSESKPKRKRATSSNDDAAVMLKVKCYQLEMKYLSIQTECKRLKIELTKERLKNAELAGEATAANADDAAPSDTSRSTAAEIMKEIEDKFSETKDANIYTMTKTSVLRSLYEDLEEICTENKQLHKELENYRAHDKFYKSLKKKLFDEEF